MRYVLKILAVSILFLNLALLNPAYAQSEEGDNASRGHALMDIEDGDGTVIARLYVGDGGTTIEALPNKFFFLAFFSLCNVDGEDRGFQIGINTNLAKWNTEGSMIEIGDVEKNEIHSSHGAFSIVGPISIAKGTFKTNTDGLGQVRIKFIDFKRGQLLSPDCAEIFHQLR